MGRARSSAGDGFDHQARSAIVTGGAGNIGRAICAALARRGDVVVVADMDLAAARAVVDELVAGGGRAWASRLDVTDGAAVAELVASVDAECPLATMVNNAGLAGARRLEEVTGEQFRALMAVNVGGVFFGTQAAAAVMRHREGGAIVNLCSTSGFAASLSPNVLYDTTKGAVRMLTISAAHELGPLGIRVNAVAPGALDREMGGRSRLDDDANMQRERFAQRLQHIPLGRLQRAEDVADAVAFLASPAASYVTGHVLVVDGGWLT